MRKKSWVEIRQIFVFCLAVGFGTGLAFADENPAAVEHFEKQIRPLLVKHCYECHSHQAKRLEGNLFLDSREGMLSGGDSGAAIVPGDSEQSLLIDSVNYGAYQMPPKGKLSDADVQLLTEWVKSGAVWPDEVPPTGNAVREVFDLKARRDGHWSWQPIQDSPVPAVQRSDWPRNAIDHFILEKLEAANLSVAPQADRSTWVRRLYFDLIGLPPSVEQVQAFVNDTRPDAKERLVDELLNSPQFGEKWARHWLDLVRYGETYGHEFDFSIPDAYKYRDYLIRAINSDVPYDQLVREHIAGDLIQQPRMHPEKETNESIIGTGFWFLGEALHAPTHVRADLSTRVENQIDVMSRAFQGLSIACARCHDHKFDAISIEDYYALYGVINSSHRDIAWLDPHHAIQKAIQELDSVQVAADHQLAKSIADNELLREGHILRYLLAASQVREQSEAAPAGETTPVEISAPLSGLADGLNEEQLRRWTVALQDAAVQENSHPASIFAQAYKLPVDQIPSAKRGFLNHAHEVLKQRERDQEQWSRVDESPFEGWQTTGNSLDVIPLKGLKGDWLHDVNRVIVPGSASTARRPPQAVGSLRSPLFTLEDNHLHYRIRGSKVTVRVVIENYFMDAFAALLFGDLRRNIDNTNGEWVSVTQYGDFLNHIGRRAYIEILDHGDGEFEIEDLHLGSNGRSSGRLPSPMALEIAGDEKVVTLEDLALQCEQKWVSALQRVAADDVDVDSANLLNWMLKHNLLGIDETLKSLRDTALQAAQKVGRPESVLAIVDGPGLDEPIHIRGSDENFGDAVPRGFLTALKDANPISISTGSGRLGVAEQVTSPENPLFARVIVNRLWHHLFGKGIVVSVDDFGVMGQPPSHPELLDWLATDFQNDGYSIKRSIRQMVLSSTYGMSSEPLGEETEEIDPENRLLHRMSVRRLPSESIRDAMLDLSNRLNLEMYGPSVSVHLTDFMEGRGRPGASGPLDGGGRRSIYQEVRRNFLSPMMLAFDMPSPFSCMGRRSVSNVPAQSLMLMNDPFVMEQAALWAKQILEAKSDSRARIELAFHQAFSRDPDKSELEECLLFLKEQSELYQCDEGDPQVWGDLCHMLFNMKEFIFLQ
ncbi:PSD1 and planctomycete cytochrome C domain-containing protein [Planctomicrobium sp. SH668]|uniref:PSD1 and planctomycete cytochrome C domain-containing protein n=1 Tax=Planctomicrobium sp. SH668 TaxID=3448126 RepID=UPI003F5BB7F1